jgi:transcriptional regulator with XRE-family HTH domain
MSVDVGARLRILRMQKGMSQRELARRAGVTNATVSLIESNRMNPSVGALKRVLDGIPIGLSEFFAMTPAVSNQLFWRKDELVEIGKGPISYLQVGGSLIERKLQILKERYEPGADTGRVMLRHDGEEGAVVIRGQLEVTVENQRRVLNAGEAYFFDSRLPHRFRNVGDGPCELISACTPPTF